MAPHSAPFQTVRTPMNTMLHDLLWHFLANARWHKIFVQDQYFHYSTMVSNKVNFMRQKHFGHRLTSNNCSTKVECYNVFVRTGLVEKYEKIEWTILTLTVRSHCLHRDMSDMRMSEPISAWFALHKWISCMYQHPSVLLCYRAVFVC